jgi:broad specificity phosphatase PhoE
VTGGSHMTTSPDVWIVRHGETEWSRTGQHTGRTDLPLTAAGEREAAELGRRLGGRRFARVLSSPLARAWETCRLAGYAATAERVPDLMEWDYGAHEGRTTDEIRADDPGWSIWSGSVPGGETAEDVGRRADRVIGGLPEVGAVLVFAHGHFLRVFAARWLGLPPRDGRLLALGTASLGVLGHENGTRVIRAWNVGPDQA